MVEPLAIPAGGLRERLDRVEVLPQVGRQRQRMRERAQVLASVECVGADEAREAVWHGAQLCAEGRQLPIEDVDQLRDSWPEPISPRAVPEQLALRLEQRVRVVRKRHSE